ncbi:MAG TPA: Gfo/Idh/MocA family oxidoreductase [Terrimicrobiaceae bacterium]|nr:Gfo/Idh/MocA family oxidoreductase [Terrimicrobiaceae bacterium]
MTAPPFQNQAVVKPVRLAIVGSGNIASTHAAAIAAIPEARLTAVCSRNAESARRIANPPGARVFRSLDELLAAELADAFLIATPSGVHAESVLPILRAGRHVLCEKPFEIHTSRVAEMISEATRHNGILAGFFPLRFGRGAEAIRRALAHERFGRLTFLSARIKWWREQTYYASSSWRGTWEMDGGGALINQGIHAVDLLQWFGGTVSEVTAYAATLAHPEIEVEDTLAACLRFSHGCLGTIEAATSCHPGLDLSVEISGTKGTAVLVNDRIDFWKFQDELPEDESVRGNAFSGAIKGGSSSPLAITSEGHRRQIKAFCQAVLGDKQASLIEAGEAARAIAIVEAIYTSTRTGMPEKVSYL